MPTRSPGRSWRGPGSGGARRDVPGAMSETLGLDAAAVGRWCADRDLLEPPVVASPYPGGRSNLTARLEGADGRAVVLRRAPLGELEHGAHDVIREGRIMATLAGTDVPVPEVLGTEPDPGVTGAPFLVTAVVPGRVVRTAADLADLDHGIRTALALDLAGVLGRLHRLLPTELGLGDLATSTPHVPRLLRRWGGQIDRARPRERDLLQRARDALEAAAPPPGPSRLVHGDFRLDNVVVDVATGRVVGVLDWELATLGEPLTDLGTLLAVWTEPGDDLVPLPDPPSLAAGMPGGSALAAAYRDAAGRGIDPDELAFHLALAQWKLACIAEGVHRREAAGQHGGRTRGPDLGAIVAPLAERALDLVGPGPRSE